MDDQVWRKSSYSGATHQNCVEVAETWRKSSYSNDTGGACVEVAETPLSILVRDTQHRALGHLGFGASAWAGFLADVKAGRL